MTSIVTKIEPNSPNTTIHIHDSEPIDLTNYDDSDSNSDHEFDTVVQHVNTTNNQFETYEIKPIDKSVLSQHTPDINGSSSPTDNNINVNDISDTVQDTDMHDIHSDTETTATTAANSPEDSLIHELQHENQQLTHSNNLLQQQLHTTTDECNQYKQRVAEKQQKIVTLIRDKLTVQYEKTQLQSQLRQLERTTESDKTEYQRILAQHKIDQAHTTERCEQYEKQLKSLQQSNEALRNNSHTAATRLREFQAKQQQTNNEQDEQINTLKSTLAQLTQEKSDVLRQRDGLMHVKTLLEQRVVQEKQQKEQLELLTKQLADMTANYNQQHSTYNEQLESHKQLQIVCSDLRQQNDYLTDLINRKSITTSTEFKQSQQLMQQFQESNKRKDVLVGENIGLQRQLAEEKRKVIAGNVNFTNEYNKLKQVCDTLKIQLQHSETAIQQITTERDTHKHKSTVLAAQIVTMRKETQTEQTTLNNTITDLHAKVQQLTADKDALTDNFTNLQKQFDSLLTQYNTLNTQHKAVNNKLLDANNKYEQIQVQYETVSQTQQISKDEYDNAVNAATQLLLQIEKLERTIVLRNMAITDVTQTRDTSMKLQEKMQTQLKLRDKEITTLSNQLYNASTAIQVYRKHFRSLFDDIQKSYKLLTIDSVNNVSHVRQQLHQWRDKIAKWAYVVT